MSLCLNCQFGQFNIVYNIKVDYLPDTYHCHSFSQIFFLSCINKLFTKLYFNITMLASPPQECEWIVLKKSLSIKNLLNSADTLKFSLKFGVFFHSEWNFLVSSKKPTPGLTPNCLVLGCELNQAKRFLPMHHNKDSWQYFETQHIIFDVSSWPSASPRFQCSEALITTAVTYIVVCHLSTSTKIIFLSIYIASYNFY